MPFCDNIACNIETFIQIVKFWIIRIYVSYEVVFLYLFKVVETNNDCISEMKRFFY